MQARTFNGPALVVLDPAQDPTRNGHEDFDALRDAVGDRTRRRGGAGAADHGIAAAQRS